MATDWQCNKSLAQCISYALDHQVACDVTFKFTTGSGEEKLIPAHRFPLSMRSPVFFAMFHGSLQPQDPVPVEDVQPAVFKEFLR